MAEGACNIYKMVQDRSEIERWISDVCLNLSAITDNHECLVWTRKCEILSKTVSTWCDFTAVLLEYHVDTVDDQVLLWTFYLVIVVALHITNTERLTVCVTMLCLFDIECNSSDVRLQNFSNGRDYNLSPLWALAVTTNSFLRILECHGVLCCLLAIVELGDMWSFCQLLWPFV